METTAEKKVRIDKWLWAARFFKTRSMAAQAVSGGKVHVNGMRMKPSKTVNPGDELRIRRGEYEFVVVVQALNDRRRSAAEARMLYEETEESRLAREKQMELRRLSSAERIAPSRRPDKRDRRLIRNFIRKQG